MGVLHFKYGVMNVGKTNDILSTDENYKRIKKKTLLMKPFIDSREEFIKSRSGWEKPCLILNEGDNIHKIFSEKKPDAILVDEAQFLMLDQVNALRDIADHNPVHVFCYGLKNNFMGNLFKASEFLMSRADKLIEMKTLCHCGRKATMILKIDGTGRVIRSGNEIDLGYEDKYVSVCHEHWSLGEY